VLNSISCLESSFFLSLSSFDFSSVSLLFSLTSSFNYLISSSFSASALFFADSSDLKPSYSSSPLAFQSLELGFLGVFGGTNLDRSQWLVCTRWQVCTNWPSTVTRNFSNHDRNHGCAPPVLASGLYAALGHVILNTRTVNASSLLPNLRKV
jgi:hypothetical protein